MDNNELLQAIGGLIDEKLKPILGEISGLKQEVSGLKQEVSGLKQGQEKTDQRLEKLELGQEKLKIDLASMFEQQTQLIQSEITGIKITIENDVTKRIVTLFDGYQLTHEKQYELEMRLEKVERKLGMVG